MASLADRLADVPARGFHVVCLPDFFLDHFVELPPYEAVEERMRAVHARGGGNLPGLRQHFAPGGNAGNTAHALAHLGVVTHLLGRTSPFGLFYMQQTLGHAGVDLRHMKADGRLAVTAVLEFGPERRNVMLNDSGSVADFGPADLDENDRTLIEGCDAVLVANWTQMRRHGTDLLLEVCRLARQGRAATFLDTGDPSSRMEDVPGLLDALAATSDLDVFAMNENELRLYAGEGTAEEAGSRLAKRFRGTLDVHTATVAASWTKEGFVAVPTWPVTPLRTTGAGDAWNAGNILGHLLGLRPRDRLKVANATAGLYLASPEGIHAGLRELRAFLEAGGA